MSVWQPIESAPKDGSTIKLLGEAGEDSGYWCEYTVHVTKELKKIQGIPEDEVGEFSADNGYGPFTHWMHLPDKP